MNKINLDLDLEICLTSEDIDEYFEVRGIINLTDRIFRLNEYMGVTASHLFGDVTIEEQYQGIKEMFLMGFWKFLNGGSET